jgi:hypothetical protein
MEDLENRVKTELDSLQTYATSLGVVVQPTATSGSVVQALITGMTANGGTIYLAAGQHIWDLVPAFPRSLTNKIRIIGLPGSRIELTTGATRAFDVAKIADHDVFQNIELSDLVVDNNSIVGVARHVLFGNKPSAVATGRDQLPGHYHSPLCGSWSCD